RFINSNAEIIPANIIHKPPSAELKHGQKDQDSLPPYDVLDKILFQYIERHQSPQDIIDMGFDAFTVRRTLKMVNNSEWKRFQFAPVLRVSPKAFGIGRRMPIEGKYLS
ncbi:MAG: NAD+ synthase, partial [Chitinophagales bacterium]